jgi:hypothetical protein
MMEVERTLTRGPSYGRLSYSNPLEGFSKLSLVAACPAAPEPCHNRALPRHESTSFFPEACTAENRAIY